MNSENYIDKEVSYFINPRLDLISLLPKNPQQKILEIGMGGGGTLVYIKENGLAAEVVGIDLMELPGTSQLSPLIDEVHFLDLEAAELPFNEKYFDVIIAGDVLEHLVNPWEMLKKLDNVLTPGGYMLISLPNIRDMYALYSILFKGSFGYTSQGIFDKTHMRFFCKKDMMALIESVETLKIEKVIPIQNIDNKNRKRKIFNQLTFKIFEPFTTSQYIFKVKKVSQ